MARPGITYDQVVAAADNIIAAGGRPTIQRVRAELGTGSPNTIHRHLAEYKKDRGIQERKRPELSVDLQTAIVKEIDRQVAAAVAELGKELTQSQAETTELSKVGERLEAEMKETVDRNQVLSEECQKLKALLDERDRQIERLKGEVSRSREEIGKIRSERDQIAEAKASAEQDAAVAKARLDVANERLSDWMAIAQDLKRQQGELREGKPVVHIDEGVTEYFQRDIETEDRIEREKSARRHIQSLIEGGGTFATIAKKLNDQAYPAIGEKSQWTWQAVKKYSK